MIKNITIQFEGFSVKVEDVVLPRIGEKVDIRALLDSDEKRKLLYDRIKWEPLYVGDVKHSFIDNKQNIEILIVCSLNEVIYFYINKNK